MKFQPQACFYHMPERPARSRIVLIERHRLGYTVTDLTDARGPHHDAHLVNLLNHARKITRKQAAACFAAALASITPTTSENGSIAPPPTA